MQLSGLIWCFYELVSDLHHMLSVLYWDPQRSCKGVNWGHISSISTIPIKSFVAWVFQSLVGIFCIC